MFMPNRLISLRKRLKRTQLEVAQKLDLNRSTYTQYEIGNRTPENATLDKLADYFGVSIDYLFGRDEQLGDIDLSDEELLKKINLRVDGVPITEAQSRMIVNVIRADRMTNESK